MPLSQTALSSVEASADNQRVVGMKRLTESQYRNSVADIFGHSIELYGRFEPDYRQARLLAVGSAVTSVSPSGYEQYDIMARGIAKQVVAEEGREQFLSCDPLADACIDEVIQHYGSQLFRRPLSRAEQDQRVAVAEEVMAKGGDHYQALEYALASLLVSPEFLFRVERVEPVPEHPDEARLTAWSRASRLSYFLWNSTPDAELLAAAERGDLYTRQGLEAQVHRLLESPRLEPGMRAFFADMLRFDTFDELSKDAALYPVFTAEVAEAMQEQTLLTMNEHLLQENASYRELFTRRAMPMNRALGMVYAVPVQSSDDWEPYEFAEEGNRAGLLSQASLLSLRAHAGSSSPTLRGLYLRETFLCQTIPPPPADVDFTLDEAFAKLPTARERLLRHRKESTCAACHHLMDPIGLTLEQFDGVGMFRTRENGALIDTRGELDGRQLGDAKALGQALSEHDGVPACLVDTLLRYALSAPDLRHQRRALDSLQQAFSDSGYRFRDLLWQIATSETFYAVPESQGASS
ncbi:hypothetical protein GCM10027297_10670 [Parahaliea aestuarii]